MGQCSVLAVVSLVSRERCVRLSAACATCCLLGQYRKAYEATGRDAGDNGKRRGWIEEIERARSSKVAEVESSVVDGGK